MKKTEVLTIKVHLLETQTVEGGAGRAVMIRFDGTAIGPLFHGRVVTDGTDTQFFPAEGPAVLSARYVLEGTDYTGAPCRIWVENNGVICPEKPVETVPRLLTDSPALRFLETAALTGWIESLPEEGWILIHVEMCAHWTEEERRIAHHGREIYGVLRRPAGVERAPLVVMSHGYGGRTEDSDAMAAVLSQLGWATYAFDFCGSRPDARSTLDTRKMTLHTEEEDVCAIVQALRQDPGVDPERVFLFGGSQGGIVSALAAETLGEQIRGMMLLFPAFCIPEHWTRDYYPAGKEVPEEIEFWGVTLGRAFVEDVRTFDLETMIGRYRGPVHIYHGDQDKIVDLSYGQWAADKYENAQLTVYPGEGHGFGKEASYDLTGRVLQFLRKYS